MTKIIIFTPGGMDEVLNEKRELLEKRPSVVDSLRRAREMGDLSENAAYKAARMELSSLDARVRHLTYLIRFGKVIKTTQNVVVAIGSKVVLLKENKSLEYEIVGSFESDPSQNKISHVSPLGQALMGKKVDEIVTTQSPSGTSIYKIMEIKM